MPQSARPGAGSSYTELEDGTSRSFVVLTIGLEASDDRPKHRPARRRGGEQPRADLKAGRDSITAAVTTLDALAVRVFEGYI
jgi:hypothetical protein